MHENELLSYHTITYDGAVVDLFLLIYGNAEYSSTCDEYKCKNIIVKKKTLNFKHAGFGSI